MPTTLTYNQQYNYSENDGRGIVVPIYLILGDRRIKLAARIDTGASCCIFNRGHGEALGLVIENGHHETIRTAAGQFNAFGHEVTLTCLGYDIHSMVYFAEHHDFDRDVLGRNGWIRSFRLGIIDYHSLLYLSHYDE